MKKVLKNPVFTFILGAIIFSSIGIVFAYSYTADEVEYSPSDTTWEVNDTSAALDSLREVLNLDYTYGEQTSTSYGNWATINLGFKPRMVAAIIPTSKGFLRAFMYIKDKKWTGYQRGSSLASTNQTSAIQLTETGFQWRVHDSSWGSQTIKYYAFK